MDEEKERLLDEQLAYYRARAGEYDEWFLRTGRYDRGPAHRAEWVAEVAAVEAGLREAGPRGHALELACGTGLWTRHLIAHATRVTAVDGSPEVIALNRERLGSDRVEYVVAGIFAWRPAGAFDFVLFAFWMSHVPPSRFEEFWTLVRGALRPGGRVFFVDSLAEPGATARDQAPLDDSGVARRRLNDGREFDIVKVYYEPVSLERRLRTLGWTGWIRGSGRHFLYGAMTPVA
jgi:demethylmenaquinone methyltransferase/2-methoxy-6-polyprenyl-1,4-benzoquinol methylase